MPAALDALWHTHGYYGTVSHNVKAIYQRYLGWYDGNPLTLATPTRGSCTTVRQVGRRSDQLAAKAQEFLDEGDLRFAAELASHAVFADPASRPGARFSRPRSPPRSRVRMRDVAQLLPDGRQGARARHRATSLTASAGMARAMTVTQLFDTIAIRIDGPRAAEPRLSSLAVHRQRRDVPHGAVERRLIHHPTTRDLPADTTVTLTKAGLLGSSPPGRPHLDIDGDTTVLTGSWPSQAPDPDFAIVTP